MAKVFIDDKEYEVADGKNMLEVCLSIGLNLTYFCWHPALDSVGACRQCAVMHYKDENDKKGRITMACMLAATDNTRISIEAAKAHEFRAGNIESLMISHPHDCPVCDEGGECHLQDMTLMSGHNYRRYRFKKKTDEDQYLGPFINHEMNRCIQCYRCVRFYKDYAGGKDLDVFGVHDNLYFGRSEPGILENEFSGNLVEVCPTGVFTDKTSRRHFTRKWDLTNAPSICHQCGLGCNILASERYDSIRRVMTRYNGDVNGYFLCDRGRFGYEYTNSDTRIKTPLKRTNQEAIPILMETLAGELKDLTAPGKKMIGIGSPRASLESNFMLKELVGANNFYGGIPKLEGELVQQIINIFKQGKVKTPSMAEAEGYDAIFILGEDVTNTAPMLALSLRQAAKEQPREVARKMNIPQWNDAAIREVVQGATGPFYLATTHATKLDEISSRSYYGHPENIARLGYAVAHQINDQLPAVKDLDEETETLALAIAEALLTAKKPLIVSGTSLFSEAIIQAASNIAHALKDKDKEAGLIYTVPEVNTIGMTMLSDQFLEDAFTQVEREKADTVFVLENDLYQRVHKDQIEAFFKNTSQSVILDNLDNKTTQHADYILPAGTFAESSGSVVNNEGRAQRFYQVYVPKNEIRSSWQWLDAIQKTQEDKPPGHFDEIVDRMVNKAPELQLVKEVAPSADFRKGTQKIPRETHRYSGRTAMDANVNVSEPKPPTDPDSPLSFTMEGYQGLPPSPDIAFFWSPGWNSYQAVNKYQIKDGGSLYGGNPGKRLLESSGNSDTTYFENIPESFSSKEGEWFVMPFYHIFGSDELSAQSPAIIERIPQPYLAMNEKDARKCGVTADGDAIELSFNNERKILKIRIDCSLPEGIAGLPKGLGETEGLQIPFWAGVKRFKNE